MADPLTSAAFQLIVIAASTSIGQRSTSVKAAQRHRSCFIQICFRNTGTGKGEKGFHGTFNGIRGMLIHHLLIRYEEILMSRLQLTRIGVAWSPFLTLSPLCHVIISFGGVWRGKPVATLNHTSLDINELIKQYLT